MTNQQILIRAARITFSHKPLWLLGIFLSSGFNLHVWYGWQWLVNSRFYESLVAQSAMMGRPLFWLAVGVVIIAGFAAVNFLKLIFVGQVHSRMHEPRTASCLFCNRVKEQSVIRAVWKTKTLWLRTIIASVITVMATTGVISLFHFYSTHSDFNFSKSVLMIASLLIILIGISWWNLLTVLFMMWYGQPLSRAAVLGAELLLVRLRRIAVITVFATVIFLVSIAAGSMVILQIPAILASAPSYLITPEVFSAWRTLVSGISISLFLAWLILNNVWFNVVMVLLFDDLVKAKQADDEVGILIANRAWPAPNLHHSIDKADKM